MKLELFLFYNICRLFSCFERKEIQLVSGRVSIKSCDSFFFLQIAFYILYETVFSSRICTTVIYLYGRAAILNPGGTRRARGSIQTQNAKLNSFDHFLFVGYATTKRWRTAAVEHIKMLSG
jgi:hypothetical protein